MSWKLAVFDNDGTLVDTLTVAFNAVLTIFGTFAPDTEPPTLDDYRKEIIADFKYFYYKHGIPETVSPDQMDAVRVSYFQAHKNEIVPFPGMCELLMLCNASGMQIAIVSASPENLEKDFAKYGVNHLINRIRSTARDKEEALVETLDFFGVKAENAFYCDDTFDGLMAAKNLGLGMIGVTHGYNSREKILLAQPDKNFVADSLYDVTKIIETGGGA